jgi:hypothetical protein
MRRVVLLSVTAAIVAMLSSVWSCGGRRDAERQLAELRDAVERELPAGSSKGQVLTFLTSRNIEHSEGKDRIIYAGIPNVSGGRWSWTKSGIYLKFYMSEQGTLLSSEVREVFTGP